MKKRHAAGKCMAALCSLFFVAMTAFVPSARARADEEVTVFISINDGESTVAALSALNVSDLDDDERITVNDALIAVHDECFEGGSAAGYKTVTGMYGKGIQKLWGIENGGSFGYYRNNALGELDAQLSDQDYIAAYVFSDLNRYSDRYAFFTETSSEMDEGQELELTLNKSDFDERYSPVSLPVNGAAVGYYDDSNVFIELGKTDAEGKVVIKVPEVEEDTQFLITAVAPEGVNLVEPVHFLIAKDVPVEFTPCTSDEDCPGVKFTDMPKRGKWSHDPIDWALENGITSGKTATTFAPNDGCSRAEVVTFLWRADGCPEPETSENPFRDISESKYYYKAVLWAYENNITSGITKNSFQPNKTCTRSEIVSFIWRYEKSPVIEADNHFEDVKAGAWYEDAVIWANETGVTYGKTETTFAPGATCTRAEVMSFIFRDFVK